jgi:hypothetical protein
MVYPSRAQTRYLAGLTVVLMLGTAGYLVTHTDASTERMSLASTRTHDIPLPGPAVSTSAPGYSLLTERGIGYIGASNGAAASAAVPDGRLASASFGAALAAPATLASGGVAFGGARDFTGSNYLSPRLHSAGGTGFSGGYGMSGVGAWGGVSGHVPAGSGIVAAATAPRVAFKPAKAEKSSGSKKSSGGGSVAGAAGVAPPLVADASGLAAGGAFSVGTTGGDPGSVPAIGGAGDSPGSSPAPNPEPMTFLLVGTGLAGLYKARHYLQ